MNLASIMMLAGLVLLEPGVSAAGAADEAAPYKAVRTAGDFELRDYPARTVVETTPGTNDNGGFMRLFHFIRGRNATGRKIAMTTPVLIAGVETNYSESITHLSEALGHIQFQDVMRQRMGSVQDALMEMRDHLQLLGEKQESPSWDGKFDSSFKDLLASHLGRYRMASQTTTHLELVGERSSDHEHPAIELF